MRKYRKAVFIVVYRKEKSNIVYLILKRKLHWKGWEFPKGGIEKNENPIQTVKRELFEETGLQPVKITNHNLRGKFTYDSKTKKERGFSGQTYNLFSVQVNKSRIRLDKLEHSGFKWLKLKDAVKKLKFNNQKKCLKIVNNSLR